MFGYLNDDVSRRRATVGTAIELCGLPVHDAGARARFHPSAPLPALGLIQVEEAERPFLSRSLRVPDRVTAHLLGDDTPDAALAGQVTLLAPRPVESAPPGGPLVEQLAERLTAGRLTVYLREQRDGDGLSCATAALAAAGLEALHFNPGQGSSGDTAAADPAAPYPAPGERGTPEFLSDLLREARLRGCPIVVAPVPERPGPLLRALMAQGISQGSTSQAAPHKGSPCWWPAGVRTILTGAAATHWSSTPPAALRRSRCLVGGARAGGRAGLARLRSGARRRPVPAGRRPYPPYRARRAGPRRLRRH